MKVKKGSTVFLKILKVFGIILAVLVLLIGIWVAISVLNSKNAIDILPRGFSLLAHTNSFYESLSPILDEEVLDVVFNQAELKDFRSLLLDLRSSTLRDNFFVHNLLCRKIDAAIYMDSQKASTDFFLIINMAQWSSLTRLIPFASNFFHISNLRFIKSEFSYFEFQLDNQSIFIRPYKNHLLLSSSFELLFESHLMAQKKERLDGLHSLIDSKNKQNFQIIIDSEKTLELLGNDNSFIAPIISVLPDESFSSLTFSLADDTLSLGLSIPLDKTKVHEATEKNDLLKLLTTKQSHSLLLLKMPATTQYYTLYNMGSLEDAKNAYIASLDDANNFNSQWDSANKMCKTFFSLSLDELIFSWTGKEVAVFGLEGKTDPIFALHIKDEKQRKKVFESFLSSIILQEGDSHIYEGLKIPSINFPSFLRSILKMFNIDLPNPFFLVKDDFIYFSNSPENLLDVYAKINRGENLAKNANWKDLDNKGPLFGLGLFYNLDRSIPFFVEGDSLLSQLLQEYAIGRSEISFSDTSIGFSLKAKKTQAKQFKQAQGFPVSLEGKKASQLCLSESKKESVLYWVENETVLASMDLKSLERKSYNFNEKIWLSPMDDASAMVWVCSQSGLIYQMDKDFEIPPLFPLYLGEKLVSAPALFNEGIIFGTDTNVVVSVSNKALISELEINSMGNFISKPSISKNYAALYAKSFIGEIFVFSKDGWVNEDSPLEIDGIAFGSPAIIEKGSSVYIAFITQAGSLYIWKDFELLDNFPKQLDGLYRDNLVAYKESFVAIDETGVLSMFDLNGQKTQSYGLEFSAKNPSLSVKNIKSNQELLFVNPDAALVFAFDKNLSEMNFSPQAGIGEPVFADVNGDKKNDMIVITPDNKICAWVIQ